MTILRRGFLASVVGLVVAPLAWARKPEASPVAVTPDGTLVAGIVFMFDQNREIPNNWALANGVDNSRANGGTGMNLIRAQQDKLGWLEVEPGMGSLSWKPTLIELLGVPPDATT